MKSIINFSFIFLTTICFGQVAIGKDKVTNASVSLEFGNANKGLVLPYVKSIAELTNVVEGTLVYDSYDKRVKIKGGDPSTWIDLSNTAGSTIDPITQIDLLVEQNTILTENNEAKVAIGQPTNTPGILVLEDKDKAMILPKTVSPHSEIINPAPGMIVYDPINNLLCVFNGKDWSFWKSE